MLFHRVKTKACLHEQISVTECVESDCLVEPICQFVYTLRHNKPLVLKMRITFKEFGLECKS